MHAGELMRAAPMTAKMNAIREECQSRDLRLLCLDDGGARRKVTTEHSLGTSLSCRRHALE
jgi:hypothetical protein